MKTQGCIHDYEEDYRFKGGGVIMLFGSIGAMKRETRLVCRKCGNIKYAEVSEDSI